MEESNHTAKLLPCFFLCVGARRSLFFHLFKYIKKFFFYNVVLISTIQCKSAIITHPPPPSPPGHQSANFSPAIHPVYVLLLLSPFIPHSPSPSVHKSILCNICVFIPSLQTGSSIPLFQIPYRHINIFVFLFLPHFTLYNRF